MQKLLMAGILALAAGLAGSCNSFVSKKPSVLVIAVDSLSKDAISCENAREKQMAWTVFCQEAVRFTHAYSPSVLSQANVASLLTARYPHEHGVWDNGKTFLSAKLETLAEAAVKNGIRTSFVSGGTPVYGKSGISQGFEYFNQGNALKMDRLYLPARSVFNNFLAWFELEAWKQSFFSFLYVPDLQFVDTPTLTDEGGYSGKFL